MTSKKSLELPQNTVFSALWLAELIVFLKINMITLINVQEVIVKIFLCNWNLILKISWCNIVIKSKLSCSKFPKTYFL